MITYILKRLAGLIPTIIAISIIVYFLLNLAPGNPAAAMYYPGMTLEQLNSMKEKFGLNKPVYIRYFNWLGKLVRGNLGYSTYTGQPVMARFAQRIIPTLQFTVLGLIIALVIGISFGVISAVKQYSLLDHFLTFSAFAGISIPVFLVGLILMYLFGLKLHLLPVMGMGQGFNRIYYIILPASALSVVHASRFLRYTRSGMLEELQKDFVRTARSKGLRESWVILKHTLRNGIIPLITIIGWTIPLLFGGAVIIESVFNYPGLGRLIYNAALQRDYPMIMGTVLLLAVVVTLINLLVDILYAFIDPRIRYG